MKHSIFLNYLTATIGLILLAACSSEQAEPKDTSHSSKEVTSVTQQTAGLSVDYTEPKDWTKRDLPNMTVFTAPEGDLVSVIVSIESAENAEAAATLAWSQYNPDFSRKIARNVSPSATNGWDEFHVITYETSPTEQRRSRASVFRANEQWRVVLLDGNIATSAKRRPAARGVVESFSVKGYSTEDLSAIAAKELTAERVKELINFVSASAKKLDVPGVGVALIQNGEVVFEGGVGIKAIGSNAPVDKDTRFMIASNTKGMTTLLLAKLVEMGKLNWDDRVIDHYPSFKLGSQETTESVLIQHLVCACTGIPQKDVDWMFNSGPDVPASATFSDLAATAPTSGFGELFQYSNQMASAAGYIAGNVLYPEMEIGAAYDKAMQVYIFDPLEMNETTFSIQEAIKGNYAKPHGTNLSDEVVIHELTADRGINHTFIPYRPAGAAWSTPHDMIKYIRNELNEGVAADGGRLFAAEPLLKRREPTVPTGENSSYGMGLSTNTISGIETIQHGGSLRGYQSQIVIIPAANTGAVILTNADDGALIIGAFVQRLVEILYDSEKKAEDQIDESVGFIQIAREKFRADLVIPPAVDVVSNLADHYLSAELGSLDIQKQGNEVILDTGFWSTPIATKENPDGTTSLVSTTLGGEMVVGKANDKRILSIIGPQHSYVFTEIDNK